MAPVQTVEFCFLGHTSLTKYCFHGSATERESTKCLIFQEQTHNPGHLLEDLQNTSREATVSIRGKEGPLAVVGLPAHSYWPPFCTGFDVVTGPKASGRAEGAPSTLGGGRVGKWGVMPIPHVGVHAFIL